MYDRVAVPPSVYGGRSFNLYGLMFVKKLDRRGKGKSDRLLMLNTVLLVQTSISGGVKRVTSLEEITGVVIDEAAQRLQIDIANDRSWLVETGDRRSQPKTGEEFVTRLEYFRSQRTEKELQIEKKRIIPNKAQLAPRGGVSKPSTKLQLYSTTLRKPTSVSIQKSQNREALRDTEEFTIVSTPGMSLGMDLAIDGGRVTIRNVTGPAATAGVPFGDLKAVGGQIITKQKALLLGAMLKEKIEKDGKVTVSVLRDKLKEFEIKREIEVNQSNKQEQEAREAIESLQYNLERARQREGQANYHAQQTQLKGEIAVKDLTGKLKDAYVDVNRVQKESKVVHQTPEVLLDQILNCIPKPKSFTDPGGVQASLRAVRGEIGYGSDSSRTYEQNVNDQLQRVLRKEQRAKLNLIAQLNHLQSVKPHAIPIPTPTPARHQTFSETLRDWNNGVLGCPDLAADREKENLVAQLPKPGQTFDPPPVNTYQVGKQKTKDPIGINKKLHVYVEKLDV